MTSKFTNNLIHSTSPYLLQHAHNPVKWFEWSEEALSKARQEHKIILVSIGYSSCHWCHVMERESFENEAVAALMNAHYVCIKVDREERPDIDQIYMEAVQALGVNGGWPLNVFLTPDQKPFFGGTYFSSQVWTQVLNNISVAFQHNTEQITGTADELHRHLRNSDVKRFLKPASDQSLTEDLRSLFGLLSATFDAHWGGMDRAPKFVMPSVWRFLLRYYYLTKDEAALTQIRITLDRISQGGIYDQLRGGFARYSVDGQWIVPHFEKMLYDNGQLLSLFSEAWAITQNPAYRKVVYETMKWLSDEMTNSDGGFYSALDADSEGVEGKFYVWTKAEFDTITGNDADIADYYEVREEGNWEHGVNILYRTQDDETFLKRPGINADEWETRLEQMKTKLLAVRNKRIRPGLDDKVITSWNAMTSAGLIDAFMATGDPIFLNMAIRNVKFILRELTDGLDIYRSYKGKRGSVKGFLDDYAYVILALTKLYQATFDETWIRQAESFMSFGMDHFFDAEERYFHFSGNHAEQLIARKKEIFDNVIPSSNALMTQNLFYLGTMLDRDDWKGHAHSMISGLGDLILSEPNYMSQWAIAMTEVKAGMKEVLIVGDQAARVRTDLQRDFRPYALWMGTTNMSDLPLFDGKVSSGSETMIYVCEQKTCQLPVSNVADARKQL